MLLVNYLPLSLINEDCALLMEGVSTEMVCVSPLTIEAQPEVKSEQKAIKLGITNDLTL